MFVEIYSSTNCAACAAAKNLCKSKDIKYEEKYVFDLSTSEWLEKAGSMPRTVPQIFVDGHYVGGLEDFKEFLCQT